MSEKTLGQVAFEVVNSEIQRHEGWIDTCAEEKATWERAAQAVVGQVEAEMRLGLQFEKEWLRGEGAAEERERIADWLHSEMDEQLSDEVRSGEHDKWLRAGGKS